MKKTMIKSIIAGFLIGMADALYLSVNSIWGAFLFAFALFLICSCEYSLFTGKIGFTYIFDSKERNNVILVLIFNLIGTALAAACCMTAKQSLIVDANMLLTNKMSYNYLQIFVKGFLCGICMYFAVRNNVKGVKDGFSRCMPIFLMIPVFILSGYEHSIADAGYMFLARNVRFFPYLAIIIVGNAIGSLLAGWMDIAITKS